MRYQLSEQPDYVRGVIGDEASLEEFASFYKELQTRCQALGVKRALVVVKPEEAVPSPDRLAIFNGTGFVEDFRLALVCAGWALYQACAKAERAATRVGGQVRAFFQETEGVRWLTSGR